MDHDPTGTLRTGPLNYAQLAWFTGWRHGETRLSHLTHPYVHNIRIDLLISDVDIPIVLRSLRILVNRHEALRTTFPQWPVRFDSQIVGSRVAKVADILEYITVGRTVASAEVARKRLADWVFQLDRDWPFRGVLEEHGFRTVRLTLVVDHSALDGWGERALITDLTQIVDAAVSGLDTYDPDDEVCQPLDVAAWEGSAAGRAYSSRAETYLRHKFERMQSSFASAPAWHEDSVSAASAPYIAASYTSSNCFRIGKRVAEKYRTHPSTIYLLAFGLTLLHIQPNSSLAIEYTVPNRNARANWSAVGNYWMRSPILIAKDDFGSVEDLVGNIATQQLKAQRHCHVHRIDLKHLLPADAFPENPPLLTSTSLNYFGSRLLDPPATSRMTPFARQIPPSMRKNCEEMAVTTTMIGSQPLRLNIFDGPESTHFSLLGREDVVPADICERILSMIPDQLELVAAGNPFGHTRN